ncbi:MAG: hypothetical protein K2P99_03080 [Burkholderiales bacterium]|nr:hypothetical protein [Burkholderiales bacterium]
MKINKSNRSIGNYIVVLLGLLCILTGCATEVPNHPVIQKNDTVVMKPIVKFTPVPNPLAKQLIVVTAPRCHKGKKGYRCRHQNKNPTKTPLTLSKQYSTVKATSVHNPNYRFESGGTVEVSEVSTAQNILTVKNVSLLQNKRGDLILSKGMVLKLLCTANSTATLNYINGKVFSVPVLIQNEDHKLTGCEKSSGAIKYIEITANVV